MRGVGSGWAGWAIAYPVSWGVGKNPAE